MPLVADRMQQGNILAQGSDAAAEGDEEHQRAYNQHQDGRVHSQTGHGSLCSGVQKDGKDMWRGSAQSAGEV